MSGKAMNKERGDMKVMSNSNHNHTCYDATREVQERFEESMNKQKPYMPSFSVAPLSIVPQMLPHQMSMDYGQWMGATNGNMAMNYHHHYIPNGYDHGMRAMGYSPMPYQGDIDTDLRGSGDGSAYNSLPNSPKHGPGPPIVTSDRVKGPKGSNLFVFHLPNEITNWDMYLLFRKYGTILSVHTMINKTTGLSRGFGFVSYSAKEEAQAAIAAMDGFRLGNKRLKVQLKRIQDDGIELEEDDFLQIDFDETSTSYNSSGTNTQASTPGNFQFKEQFIHVANNDQQIMNSGAIASKPINSTIKRNSRASKSSNKNFFDGNSCDGFNAASKDSSFSVENDAITDSEERSRRDSENSRTSCDTSAKQKNDDFKRDSAAVPKHSKN